jgi:hypothetical protein
MYVCMRVCMYVCMYACVRACVRISVYECVHLFVYALCMFPYTFCSAFLYDLVASTLISLKFRRAAALKFALSKVCVSQDL